MTIRLRTTQPRLPLRCLWRLGFRWLLIAASLTPTAVHARTLVVDGNPSGARDVVKAVLAQAQDGDTIQINAGTYYENLDITQRSLTILGAGASVTTLYGEDGVTILPGAVIRNADMTARDLVIEGITFAEGTSWRGLIDGAGVGGNVCWSNEECAGSFAIRNCVIERGTAAYGGGLYVHGLQNVLVESCEFRSNHASRNGGNVFLAGCLTRRGEIVFAGNTIEIGGISGRDAGGFFAKDADRIEFSGNRVSSTPNPEPCRGIIILDVKEIRIDGNVIDDDGGDCASYITAENITYGGSTVEFVNNTVRRSGGSSGSTGVTLSSLTDLIATGNSIWGVRLSCNSGYGGGTLSRNAVQGGTFAAGFTGTGEVTCNVTWPDPILVTGQRPVMTDNVVADPLFCDAEGGDFRVAATSPCVTNPACERIGAYTVGCGDTPVLKQSWGAIKARWGEAR